MSTGKVAVGVALLLALGGKKKRTLPPFSGRKPGSADLPPGEPEEPLDGPVEPPPKPAGALPLQVVWTQLMAPDPTPGRGYQIRKGDMALGGEGVFARALRKVLGRPPTPSERLDYYQAGTRVRTSWLLYATDEVPGSTRVTVQGLDGTLVDGSITAAFLPMHDPWAIAVGANQLPRRLIRFTRQVITQGPNQGQRKVLPLVNWIELSHSATRTYGALYLPEADCIAGGLAITASPECDWPQPLWDSAGLARLDWKAS